MQKKQLVLSKSEGSINTRKNSNNKASNRVIIYNQLYTRQQIYTDNNQIGSILDYLHINLKIRLYWNREEKHLID